MEKSAKGQLCHENQMQRVVQFTSWELQKGQVKSDFRIAVAVVCSWVHLHSKAFVLGSARKTLCCTAAALTPVYHATRI